MPGDLLTVAEVAERLGVTTGAVLDWIKRGEIRASNLGGRAGWRIRPQDVEAFLDARSNIPPNTPPGKGAEAA
jgi:excisionase family DNA binding protein